jgi:hypothetical protein
MLDYAQAMCLPFVKAKGSVAAPGSLHLSMIADPAARRRPVSSARSLADRAFYLKLWLLERAVDLAAGPLRFAGSRNAAQRRFYHFARLTAALLRPLTKPRPARVPPIEADIVNRLITRLNRREPGFPLMFKLAGGQVLEAAERLGKGVLIATVHSRLALATHAALRSDSGSPIIVGFCTGRDMRGWNWGHSAPINAIEARDPLLFRKLARQLANGRRIVCFVDHGQSTDQSAPMRISPNLFAWAQGAGIPVVFMLTRLTGEGQIEITLHSEPASDASGAIDAFLRFIEREGGWRCVADRRRHSVRPATAVAARGAKTNADREIAIAA